jgi:hypothetical protein
MATKNNLFFIKMPEKGKKLSTPIMVKRYHKGALSVNVMKASLPMSFLEKPKSMTALLTIKIH